jgi:hypothetical protein
VFKSTCHLCENEYYFDGRQWGILNYDNRYLFDVELMSELSDLKLNGSLATNTWWKTKVDQHLQLWEPDQTTMEFRQRWMNLSGKLTCFLTEFYTLVDYPSDIFACCADPEIISADGMKLHLP